ncbi:MAG TPA: glycosyltransferase family 1 protein [Tepidisphaeraceae bacterium]|jgi:glycosyltransferase involved in cell wall biosynthesis|nr:glycosyltransferase family 1 protein [Tepidisphaeraceae bacterium]
MNFYVDARALQKPNWRGEQFYVYEIIDRMADLGREHTFHLHFGWECWNDRLTTLAAKPNIVAHRHPGRVRSHLSIPFEILRTGSRVYYRMYNEDSPMRVAVSAPIAALVHDNGRHLYPSMYGVDDALALRARTARHIRRFGRIITVSQTVKEEIIKLFKLSPHRIVVASNGLQTSDPAAPAVRPNMLPSGAVFFLLVNPGGAHKNWRQALQGFAAFANRRPVDRPIYLVIAGDLYSQETPIAQTIAAIGSLRGRVLRLGYVSDAELRYLYRHARLMVYTSRYEGFGRPILEAMAYGVPVIVSDIPVFREVAGDAAVRVPLDDAAALADAFERVECDIDLRSQLIESGRNRIEAYPLDHSAKATLDALVTLGRGNRA